MIKVDTNIFLFEQILLKNNRFSQVKSSRLPCFRESDITIFYGLLVQEYYDSIHISWPFYYKDFFKGQLHIVKIIP